MTTDCRVLVLPDGTQMTVEDATALIEQTLRAAQGAAPLHVCNRQVLGTRCITCEQSEWAAPLDLFREVAASGVVHEAEPPGIDYVTVQVDMDTWRGIQAWAAGLSEGAAPRAEGPPHDLDEVKRQNVAEFLERQALQRAAPRAEGLDRSLMAEAMWGHQPADLRDTDTGSLHCGRECADAIAGEYDRLVSRPFDERVPESEEQDTARAVCNRFRHDEHCAHLHES